MTGSLNEQQATLQRQCSTPSATTCPVCVLVSCSFPLMTCKRPECTAVPLLQLEPNLKLSNFPPSFPNTVITQSRRWLLFIHPPLPPLLAIFHPPTPSITQSLFLLHPSTPPYSYSERNLCLLEIRPAKMAARKLFISRNTFWTTRTLGFC